MAGQRVGGCGVWWKPQAEETVEATVRKWFRLKHRVMVPTRREIAELRRSKGVDSQHPNLWHGLVTVWPMPGA